ncbi:MAG: 30S ribosomal protein S7 [Candidatus Micrarchaeota archaeon]|nr:30S ribosomal protein S7 [Candidatus Micrarchaeota archaeon]
MEGQENVEKGKIAERGGETKLFGKYSFEGIEVRDPGIRQYASFTPVVYPHTFARHANKQFAKSKVNVVERLANKLMRGGTGGKLGGKLIRTHGKLQGKKLRVLKIMEDAFAIILAQTKQNPVQVLVRAIENSAPREDVTSVRFGGIAYQVAVDVAAQRRLDMALRNITVAAIMGSFNKKPTLAETLANEIILAGKGDPNSYAIKRRNDTERMSRSAR